MNLKLIKSSYLILLILFCLVTTLGIIYKMSKPNKSTITVLVNGAPDSLDPIKYDSFINHIAFGSINSSLVSQYNLGEHSPEIAQSWTNNENFTEWKFVIKSYFKYSDGTLLTPEHIVNAWLRVAKIMKSRNSKSGFFENLAGFSNLTPESKNIDGLSFENNLLKINLIKPMPKLLDIISFGLYAIPHPSNYEQSGEWLNQKNNIVSSGPYKIISWNDTKLVLQLRSDYSKNLLHENPIRNIEIFWDQKNLKDQNFDLYMGNSLNEAPVKNYILQAGPPSSILFLRLLSWRDKSSIFFNKENRQNFREIFYNKLQAKNIKITRSFFPLIINGVNEFAEQIADLNFSKELFKNKKITIPNFPKQNATSDGIVNASLDLAKDLNLEVLRKDITFSKLMEELISEKSSPTWDLTRYMTGILAASPEEDIKFMFLSKEGILLPDSTGEILKEIGQTTIDVQKVNQLLWDQAIIWPVTHYSSGLWAAPDIDFSKINLVLPPTRFQWIGWKN
jgi:ABC-type transport system substrate-binding protein